MYLSRKIEVNDINYFSTRIYSNYKRTKRIRKSLQLILNLLKCLNDMDIPAKSIAEFLTPEMVEVSKVVAAIAL